MLAPFLIMLREGIEVALIVGIIASYLSRTGRSSWLPAVWIGVLLAIAASFFAGAAFLLLTDTFPQKTQEGFEAAVGVAAVVILLSMVVWMRRAARNMRSTLDHSVDEAMASRMGPTWALIGMAFFAVAREGLESVFFLLAIFQQSPGASAPLGALAGVGVALILGIGIYTGGVRLDLRVFFRWTGIVVVLVAAGLAATVLRNLHEAGVWNHLQQPVWDMSRTLPVSSVAGTVLSGLFGYHDTPALGEVIVWAMMLALGLWLLLRPAGEGPARVATQGRV